MIEDVFEPALSRYEDEPDDSTLERIEKEIARKTTIELQGWADLWVMEYQTQLLDNQEGEDY